MFSRCLDSGLNDLGQMFSAGVLQSPDESLSQTCGSSSDVIFLCEKMLQKFDI